MQEIETGGHAFPTPSEEPSDESPGHYAGLGMTLRDYFAAKALQGMLAFNGAGNVDERADEAYRYADAMLKSKKL